MRSATAAWSAYAVGIAVALFALIALAAPRRWAEWVELALSVLLLISPFLLLFYGNERGAAWNAIVAGLLVGAGAISVLARHPRRRMAHAR